MSIEKYNPVSLIDLKEGHRYSFTMFDIHYRGTFKGYMGGSTVGFKDVLDIDTNQFNPHFNFDIRMIRNIKEIKFNVNDDINQEINSYFGGKRKYRYSKKNKKRRNKSTRRNRNRSKSR